MELPSWSIHLSASLLNIAKIIPKVSKPIYSLPPRLLSSCFSTFNACQHLVFSDLNNICQSESGRMRFHYYLNLYSPDYESEELSIWLISHWEFLFSELSVYLLPMSLLGCFLFSKTCLWNHLGLVLTL